MYGDRGRSASAVGGVRRHIRQAEVLHNKGMGNLLGLFKSAQRITDQQGVDIGRFNAGAGHSLQGSFTEQLDVSTRLGAGKNRLPGAHDGYSTHPLLQSSLRENS